MENLLLCFSSFHVDSDPSNMREEEYAICYEQLLRVLPSNFDVVLLITQQMIMLSLKDYMIL